MHKRFINVVDYAKSKGLSQTLITNGIIPGTQVNKYVSIMPLFSKIQVSVNSSGNTYDEMVGVKMYDRLPGAITNITSMNQNVWLSFVVTRNNSDDIPKIVELAENTGCIGVRFGILVKQGRGGNENIDYFVSLRAANNKIIESQKKHPSVKIECHFNNALSTREGNNSHYSEGISMLFINLIGEIYPFPLLEVPEMKIGNIFTDNLLEVWRESPILDQFRNKDAINPTCINCETPCALRAPSISYLWSGNIGAKVPCARFNYEQ